MGLSIHNLKTKRNNAIYDRFSTTSATANENTTMWTVRTEKAPKRTVTTIENSPSEECPLVWRKWTRDFALKHFSSNFIVLLGWWDYRAPEDRAPEYRTPRK